MHQEHNVPWHLVSQNVRFIKDNPAVTPHTTGLFSRQKLSQANELNHFVRRLRSTIEAFSQTERMKYPSHFTAFPTTGQLFSDELRRKYPEFLNERNQRIEYWIEQSAQSGGTYSTSHGDFADVVKVLMAENQFPTLLMMANHPSIPLLSLHSLSWGHHFGISRVREAALEAYLFFNIAAACGLLETGEYRELNAYRSLVSSTTSSMDYPAQQIPHRIFFYGSHDASSSSWQRTREYQGLPVVHKDYARLQVYLKLNFHLLYCHKILLRELALQTDLEAEIVYTLRRMLPGVKVDTPFDGSPRFV